MGEMHNACKVLVRKPKRKRQLGRRRHRWEENIKMDLEEIERDGVEWMCMALDRVQWRIIRIMIHKRMGIS
jgi:hypothetical protein